MTYRAPLDSVIGELGRQRNKSVKKIVSLVFTLMLFAGCVPDKAKDKIDIKMTDLEKYPEEHTNHYIAMLSANFDVFDDNSFREMALMYQEIEGTESLKQAILEFDKIIDGEDWEYLEYLISHYEIKGFDKQSFMRMVDMTKAIDQK